MGTDHILKTLKSMVTFDVKDGALSDPSLLRATVHVKESLLW